MSGEEPWALERFLDWGGREHCGARQDFTKVLLMRLCSSSAACLEQKGASGPWLVSWAPCPPLPTGQASCSFLFGLHQPLLHEASVQLLDVGVDTLGVRHCQPHHVIHFQQLGTVGQFPEG